LLHARRQFPAKRPFTQNFLHPLIYERKIDLTALLVLWQPSLAGELSHKRFETTAERIHILVHKLARDYPLDHTVILYEAATNPMEMTRMDHLQLRDLPTAHLVSATTLVIPPAQSLELDIAIMAQLNSLHETQLSELDVT
jgi:hypothetical protein